MNLLETIATKIRHSKYLSKYNALWDSVRPLYNQFISQYGKKGLLRKINGTDNILVLPEFRGVAEVYETDVWHHFMANLQTNDRVVDVGSYIGLYAIAIGKRLNEEGKVYAFEPDPNNFKALESHIKLNQLENNVEAINLAVADKVSTVYFQSGRDSQSFVSNEYSEDLIPVNSVSLDNYFPTSKIDILKIDVEGYEEKVIQGATNLLSDKNRKPRLIYLEVHPFAWSNVGTNWDSLLNLLQSHNYKILTFNGDRPESITWWGEVFAQRLD
ncbi:MAG: FkbM family methyltransferase [Gomphosphaeria aponina SAG 52.96 = DSM 107014]|uniref:FkbM family methyltransferase n=1 Tax=Gomphosphaeria aponina SAG 52.96 = DSM 107014 TaxID=1521640 RepID=A0A941JT47_9CHRO|nr:FkbM family methyltransferase [Gomphosphaeria aponina SAG 52.96 = DSM 107014]